MNPQSNPIHSSNSLSAPWKHLRERRLVKESTRKEFATLDDTASKLEETTQQYDDLKDELDGSLNGENCLADGPSASAESQLDRCLDKESINDFTSCRAVIKSALHLLPGHRRDPERSAERVAQITAVLGKEEITHAWQLRTLDSTEWARAGVSLGLRAAIERVLRRGMLGETIETPFSARVRSASAWLWDSQREQMMTEKLAEDVPRVAQLLQFAGLLPVNASLPLWYPIHRCFVSVVVYVFAPFIQAIYLYDSCQPEEKKRVHRLPYRPAIWVLYLMLNLYSAGFRFAALKAMSDTGSLSRLVKQVNLPPKKKNQLNRWALIDHET
jgi:hypothetical protein